MAKRRREAVLAPQELERKRAGLKLWGHRGCRDPDMPPENSLAAFRAAIAGGADGIELDVFLTRDEQLVVFHDETLERLSNGSGAIRSHSLAYCQSLLLRSTTGEITRESIPTLSEVLDMVETWRRHAPTDPRAAAFVVNIETKGQGISGFVAKEIERRVRGVWRYANFVNSSFDVDSLTDMRRLLPQLPLGALFEGPLGRPQAPYDVTLDELRLCVSRVTHLKPDTVNITLPSLRQPGALEIIRGAGARPVAWTSNERPPDTLAAHELEDMIGFLRANEITLITDFPGKLRALDDSMETGTRPP